MIRTLARQVAKTLTYSAGQLQETFQLPAGRLINELIFQIDVGLTTTTATLNPHPAGVSNLIARLEVFTSNAKTIIDVSGQDLWDMFGKFGGYIGDNVALAGGVNATTTARQTLRLPFYLEDGQRPDDGILQTETQDVSVRITYNVPTAAGTFFGTVAGLSAVTATVRVSFDEFRVDAEARAAIKKVAVERSLRKIDYPVNQSNDAFVLDKLPKNESYRKVTLMARSTLNNMTQGDATVIDHTKEAAVKSSADNNTYQRDVVRAFRGETIQRRRDASLTAGVIDFNFLKFGSLVENIRSTTANELSLEVPAVTNANSPFIRAITDTVRSAF